jgi:hypothetical protein
MQRGIRAGAGCRVYGCRAGPSLSAIEQMLQVPADIGFGLAQVVHFRLQLGGGDGTSLVLNQRIQAFDLPLECISDWPQPRMRVVTYTLL